MGLPFCLRVTSVGALALVAMFTHPAFAGDPSEEAARKHFMAGVAYLQIKKASATRSLRRVQSRFRSFPLPQGPRERRPVPMKLERDGEAIAAYTRYLAEVPDIDPDERAQIVRDVETLNASAVRVSMSVHQKGATLYDTRFPVRGANISNVYTPVIGKNQYAIRPGHHVITLKIEGRDRAAWEVTAPAGATLEHDFVIQPDVPVPTAAPRSTIRDATRGHRGGGGDRAAGTVVGLVALGKVHQLEGICPNDACPSQSYSEVGKVRTWVRTTDYLFLAGGVVTAGGLAWLLLPSSSPSSRTRVGGICTDTGCYGTFRVGF